MIGSHVKKLIMVFLCLIGCVSSFDVLAKPMALDQVLQQRWDPYRALALGSSSGQFTMTGTGTIRFIKLFFYSDTGCSTRLGDASILGNGLGFEFSNGQSVSINASSVYKLASNQGITTDDIACMKVYMNGSNESSKGVACQSFTDETCTGTRCTSNQVKTVTWDANPTSCAARYAYVTNYGNKSVTQCTVSSSDGSFSGCTETGSDYNKPRGIAINDAYAYITNYSNKTVTKCKVSASDGTLSNCATTGSDFNKPKGIAISNGYAYVLNLTGSEVIQCSISVSDGSLSSCASTGSNFNKPRGIALNNSYAYITNDGDKTITQCSVSSVDGSFSDCTSTDADYNKPRGIQLSNGYAYIVLNKLETITYCTVSALDGSLSGCAETGSSFDSPIDIRMSDGYAYISNQSDSTISKCTVDASTGALSDCANTGSDFNKNKELYIY